MRLAVLWSLVSLLIIVGIGSVLWFNFQKQSTSTLSPTATSTVLAYAQLPDSYITPGQRSFYTDSEQGFTFEIPKNFSVGNYGVGTKEPEVLLATPNKADLILLHMTPAAGTFEVLTAEEINRNVPTLQVDNPKPFSIVPGITGVVFDSTNEEWGRSHEIWFLHRGTLYRMSTAERLSALLEAIMYTWHFTK